MWILSWQYVNSMDWMTCDGVGLSGGRLSLWAPSMHSMYSLRRAMQVHVVGGMYIVVTIHVLFCFERLGIRGTQVKSSIQDIVDEVAPIKKAPLWD